jgi:methionine-rich copper-binding protein CopC
MNKHTLWIGFIFMITLMLPTAVYAHSGLTASTPEQSEIVKSSLSQIQLTFSTAIKQFSRLNVTDANGNSVKLSVKTDKETMTGLFTKPLDNGIYKVDWRIIGTDGHGIKGSYSFEVQAPVTGAADSGVTGEAPGQEQPSDVNNSDPFEQANAAQAEAQAANIAANKSSSALDSKDRLSIAAIAICAVLFVFMIRSVRK